MKIIRHGARRQTHVLNVGGRILCNQDMPGKNSVVLDALTLVNVARVDCQTCRHIARSLMSRPHLGYVFVYEQYDQMTGKKVDGHEIRDSMGITGLKSLNRPMGGQIKWRIKGT